MSFQKQASRAISLLTLIEVEGNSIERIIAVVQENHEYFGAKIGDSCLEKAANKLEQLTKEAAQHRVNSDSAEGGPKYTGLVETHRCKCVVVEK